MNVKMSELIAIDGVQFSAGDVLYKHKRLGFQVGDNEFELTPEGAVELGFAGEVPSFPLGATKNEFDMGEYLYGDDGVTDFAPAVMLELPIAVPALPVEIGEVAEVEVEEKKVKIDRRLKANKGK